MNASKNNPESSDKKKMDDYITYNAEKFVINIDKEWKDKTIFTLTGPVSDGIQHNILITMEEDIPFDAVIDYAEWQIAALEDELKGCLLLLKGEVKLDNGMPAYEAMFRWYPSDDLRIYQHQIFVLHENKGYKLTASFTKKTRKTLGPEVERMMLSFKPIERK